MLQVAGFGTAAAAVADEGRNAVDAVDGMVSVVARAVAVNAVVNAADVVDAVALVTDAETLGCAGAGMSVGAGPSAC